ncbi:MAG: LysM peptidoglycan-binding domain-containing protein [Chloroflexi bacterium]|nr:LysM peptidoglycan-binding domain-containing protein [Chloroflexota bacterium]
MLLLLAGCYQQASESFQPVNQTEIPVNVPEATGGLQDLTAFPATATLPPITIIAPTRSLLVTPETPSDQPTAESQTTDNTPGEPTTEAGVLPEATPAVQPTQATFITPFSPIGPVTVNAPTPTFALGAASATPSGLITPTAFVEGGNECTYTVRSGDNLFRIATNNNVSLAELRQANPQLTGDLLQPGQILQIPGCTPGGGSPDTAVTAPDTPAAETNPGSGTMYTVKPGDTLFTIARQFNTTIAAIVEANNLANPDRLSVGQQLIIPAPSG